MYRYADPDACPGCREPIDHTHPGCPACGVPLRGDLPRQVFRTLEGVDRLVDELRAAPVVGRATAPPLTATVPVASEAPAPASILSAASVPRILLGLGALCLLVAAIVFLVVAWASLGVGGRTRVLTGFTVSSGVLACLVARRGLRAGSEAFTAVVLGLLVLDLAGAREAGWLGAVDDEGFLLLAGATVALVAGLAAVLALGSPVARSLSAEVMTVAAVGAAALGASQVLGGRDAAFQVLVAFGLCAAAALAAGGLGLKVPALGCAGEAVICWVALVVVAVADLAPQSFDHVWGDLAVWPTLVAASVAALLAVPAWLPSPVRVSAAAAAAVLATLAVCVVGLDETPTRIALVEMAVIACYAVVAVRLRRPWTWVAAVPSSIAAVALAVSVMVVLGASLATLPTDEPWSTGLAERMDAPDMAWSWPLLLPAGVIAIAATLATVLRCGGRAPRLVVGPSAAVMMVALTLVPPLYGVPLGVAVLCLVVGAAVLGVVAIVTWRQAPAAAAVATLVLAVCAALASEVATAAVMAGCLVAAVVAEQWGSRSVRLWGSGATPAVAAALTWTLGHLAGLPLVWQALPVVVVLGTAIVLRPAAVREVVAAGAMAAAVAGSVLADGPLDQTWLAVYLSLGGGVATASSLLHPDRRRLGGVGLALFTAAQWVRLQQLGVDTVEAYTLPLAVVLLALGAVALARGSGSSIRLLGPGLGLALLPTLLQVLADPVGTRAVLLGIACLALVAVGIARGLAAPLLAGAVVGGLVVLREGTLAQVLPQWATIGLVGVGLTAVGITWEQRVQELRTASAYVLGLR